MPLQNTALIILLVLFGHLWLVQGCNEALCGSIVSKCLLIKSCNCESKSKCFKECFNCLGLYYTYCCSCVGICPVSSDLEVPNKTSIVEDFPEPIPPLFEALSQTNEGSKWSIEVFPVDLTVHNGTDPVKLMTNCTVVFLSNCITGTKCRNMCLTMGSSSYRWFHNGCCECVGESCINYGLKESKCRNCPRVEDGDEFMDENDLSYDYGEDEDLDEMIGEE